MNLPQRPRTCGAIPLAAEQKIGGRVTPSLPPADDEEEDEEDELAVDDDDEDEDLIIFTAREAAGALATVSSFTWPFLSNYKSWMTIVGFGLLVETLFNVIMPLSLKYLIDDALGEEDFQALYTISRLLAVAGIITSIVAICTSGPTPGLGPRCSPTCGSSCSSTAEPAGGIFLSAPSAARSCRDFRSTWRPMKEP